MNNVTRAIFGMVAPISIGFAMFAACTSTEKVVKNEFQLLDPPIPELAMKFQEFEIDNSKDEILKIASGTSISIPAGAFVDKDGKPVEGKVKIKYREFHDAVDVLLSGIPMDYQNGTVQETFQTAGMFELRGEKDGEALAVANGKNINVRLASFESGKDYPFYQLEETGKGWQLIDTTYKIEVNEEKEILKKKISKKIPSTAFPLDSKYFVFDYNAILDVQYNDDYYKIRDNKSNPAVSNKAKKYGLSWINVNAHTEIKYKGVNQVAAMMVWKKASGNSFPAWTKDEKQDFTKFTAIGGNFYKIEIESNDGSKKFNATIEAVMPLTQLYKFSPEYWENNYNAAMAKVEEEMERLKKEVDVFRSFEVAGFGIYNYDKFMKMEDPININADFQVEASILKNHETFEMNIVYCLPEDNKTVIKLPKDDWGKVSLIPGTKCRFITVLPGGAIGVYSAEKYMTLDFEGLRKLDDPKVIFEMVKEMEKPATADALKGFMGI